VTKKEVHYRGLGSGQQNTIQIHGISLIDGHIMTDMIINIDHYPYRITWPRGPCQIIVHSPVITLPHQQWTISSLLPIPSSSSSTSIPLTDTMASTSVSSSHSSPTVQPSVSSSSASSSLSSILSEESHSTPIWSDTKEEQEEWHRQQNNNANDISQPNHSQSQSQSHSHSSHPWPRCPQFLQSSISNELESYLNEIRLLRPHRDIIRQQLLTLLHVHDVIDTIILHYLAIPQVCSVAIHFSSTQSDHLIIICL
jgi:hypothetical protein